MQWTRGCLPVVLHGADVKPERGADGFDLFPIYPFHYRCFARVVQSTANKYNMKRFLYHTLANTQPKDQSDFEKSFKLTPSKYASPFVSASLSL